MLNTGFNEPICGGPVAHLLPVNVLKLFGIEEKPFGERCDAKSQLSQIR